MFCFVVVDLLKHLKLKIMRHFLYITPKDVTVDQFNDLVAKCKSFFSDVNNTGHYGFCNPTYELFSEADNGYFLIDDLDGLYNWGIDNNPQRAKRSSYEEMIELLTTK